VEFFRADEAPLMIRLDAPLGTFQQERLVEPLPPPPERAAAGMTRSARDDVRQATTSPQTRPSMRMGYTIVTMRADFYRAVTFMHMMGNHSRPHVAR
jgi:hypothetical protein